LMMRGEMVFNDAEESSARVDGIGVGKREAHLNLTEVWKQHSGGGEGHSDIHQRARKTKRPLQRALEGGIEETKS